jgi:hypothetical protein
MGDCLMIHEPSVNEPSDVEEDLEKNKSHVIN